MTVQGKGDVSEARGYPAQAWDDVTGAKIVPEAVQHGTYEGNWVYKETSGIPQSLKELRTGRTEDHKGAMDRYKQG